jgi:hypothetical protein
VGEAELQASIVSSLERLGYLVIRVQSGKVKVKGGWMQLAPEGTPDLHVMSPGLATWLETKVKDGKLRPSQVAWHERAKKGGHRVAVVRSVAEALQAVSAPQTDREWPFPFLSPG